jgi:hypothetical protein
MKAIIQLKHQYIVARLSRDELGVAKYVIECPREIEDILID